MIRPVTSMSASPLMHFISCEMSSLVRSNAVWNTMTVNKIFCKSVDGDVGREDKLICRIPTYSSGKKKCASKMKVIQCNRPATRCLAGLLKEWYHIGSSVLVGRFGIQQWLVAKLALVSPCHWNYAKSPSMLPCCFVYKPMDIHRMDHLVNPIIKITLCWDFSLMSIHSGYKYLHHWAHLERSIQIPLFQSFLSSNFQLCSFQVPDQTISHGHEWIWIQTSSHISFQAR